MLFGLTTMAHAEEQYPGFTCEIVVRGISGSVRKALEMKPNGHTYQQGNRTLPRFDLVFTPTYKVNREQPAPQVIATDLVVSEVHPQQALIVDATTANFNDSGATFRELNTKLIRETGLGSSGPYVEENLIVSVKTRGVDAQFTESFWSTSCHVN